MNPLKKALLKAKGKSNYILATGAVIGLGTTIYFVAKGQMKADAILAAKRNEGAEDLTKKEAVNLTWKCFIPAGISTAATLFCIIGSNYISAKQIAALTGSLAFMTANRDQLEEAIKNKYGEDALNDIKSKLQVRKPEVKIIRTIAEETGHGDLLCFEGYSGRWFRCSKEWVEKAFDDLDNLIKGTEYACFNDLYRFLGIEETHFGYEYGWIDTEWESVVEEGDHPIKRELFKCFDEEKGEDVLYIDIYTYPIERYYEY